MSEWTGIFETACGERHPLLVYELQSSGNYYSEPEGNGFWKYRPVNFIAAHGKIQTGVGLAIGTKGFLVISRNGKEQGRLGPLFVMSTSEAGYEVSGLWKWQETGKEADEVSPSFIVDSGSPDRPAPG